MKVNLILMTTKTCSMFLEQNENQRGWNIILASNKLISLCIKYLKCMKMLEFDDTKSNKEWQIGCERSGVELYFPTNDNILFTNLVNNYSF